MPASNQTNITDETKTMMTFHVLQTPYDVITAVAGSRLLTLRLTQSTACGEVVVDAASLLSPAKRNYARARFAECAANAKVAGVRQHRFTLQPVGAPPRGWQAFKDAALHQIDI